MGNVSAIKGKNINGKLELNYLQSDMDSVRKLLLDLHTRNGVTMKALSLYVGKNEAYLNQYIKRGSPKTLPEDVREKLGNYFGLDPLSFKVGRSIELEPAQTQGPLPILEDDAEALTVLAIGTGIWPDGQVSLVLQLAERESLALYLSPENLRALRRALDKLEPFLTRRQQT